MTLKSRKWRVAFQIILLVCKTHCRNNFLFCTFWPKQIHSFFPPSSPFFLFFYFSLLFLKGASTPSGSTWRSTAIFKMALYWSQKRWARFFLGILLIVLGIGENRYARTVSIHYIMEYVLHILIIYILFCISEKDIKMDAL